MEEISGFYKQLLDNLYDGVYFVNSRRQITYWNRAAERITGFSPAEVMGKCCYNNILRHVDETGTELCGGPCPLARTIADGHLREADVFLHHKDGHRIPVSVRVAPIFNAQGKLLGAVELFADNSYKTMMLARVAELEQLSLLDPLTRLGNRRFVEMNLQSRLDEMGRYGLGFGVLFLDIDHFKKINDTYGHEIGDDVLRMVANTLVSNARPFDVFGRWGGEEFVGIIRSPDIKGMRPVAERLRTLVGASFLMNGENRIRVTISVGLTAAKRSDTLEGLLRRADQLMYASKTSGRNCVSTDIAGSSGQSG